MPAGGGGAYLGFTSLSDTNQSSEPNSPVGSPPSIGIRRKTIKVVLDDIQIPQSRPTNLFRSDSATRSKTPKKITERNTNAFPVGALSRKNSQSISEDMGNLEESTTISAFKMGKSSIDDLVGGNPQNLKTTAINGVYKIMQDRRAQEHIALQKYALLAIPSKTTKAFELKYGQESYEPIVDLCLINSDRKEEPPNGYEVVKNHILRGAKNRYLLCFKRKTATDIDKLPIVDVRCRFQKFEPLPFGYDSLNVTASGEPVEFPDNESSQPVSIIFTRFGIGFIKSISIIHTNKEDPVPPPGYVINRKSLLGEDANLNASSDDRQAWIALLKDLSPYIISQTALNFRSDLKYVTPLLLALQTMDESLVNKGLTYLEILLSGNYFESPGVHLYIHNVLDSLLDGISSSIEDSYQTRLFQAIKFFLEYHVQDLQPSGVYFLLLSTFRFYKRESRVELQKVVIEEIVKNFVEDFATVPQRPATSKKEIVMQILDVLAERVARAKNADIVLSVFEESNVFALKFRRMLEGFCNQAYKLVSGKRVVALLCILARLGFEKSFSGKHLEAQYESLSLLEFLLKCLVHYQQDLDPQMVFCISRLVFPTLSANVIYRSSKPFIKCLNILKYIWKEFGKLFFKECGFLLFNVIVNLLENNSTKHDKLQTLVDFLTEILEDQFKVVEWYYNFDNIRNIPLFEKLIACLCELAERSRKSYMIQNVPPKNLFQLQKSLADLIVTIIRAMHDWFRDMKVIEYKEDEAKLSEPSKMKRDTVVQRFTLQQQKRESMAKALTMLKVEKKTLKKVVQFLIATRYFDQNARSIASWVFEHHIQLGLEEVGDFIGGSAPIEREPLEEQIRLAFIRQMDFPLGNLDEALRIILTEGGFRLPKEAQKIDRIMCSTAQVFFEKCPENFTSKDGVYVLSTAILMLNTSLHNPNVKEKERLSEAMFISICKGIEETTLKEPDIRAIFHRIQKNPYQIDFGNVVSVEDETRFKREIVERNKKEGGKVYRKTISKLKALSTQTWTLFETRSSVVIYSMFELSWITFLGCLDAFLKAEDIRVVPTVLNGFKFALSLALGMQIPLAREAFSTTLADFVFRQNHDEEDVEEQVAKNAHLEQFWYVDLRTRTATGDVSDSIKIVRKLIDQSKAQFVQETNCRKLRELQELLHSDVNIIHSDRAYLGQGDIFKIASRSSKKLYRMFVFSDALMFCTGDTKHGFKVHQVIQLAYCKITAFDHSTQQITGVTAGFQIINPQKSVSCVAASKEDMEEWMREINEAIYSTRKNRRSLINTARNLLQLKQIDEKVLFKLENTAYFLGKSQEMLIPLTEMKRYDDRCKLCFSVFAIFTRARQCGYCEDPVCSNCISNKSFVPTKDKKLFVCDVCFGILERKVTNLNAKTPKRENRK